MSNKAISKNEVINNSKLIIELVEYQILTNTFIFRERLLEKNEDGVELTKFYKNNYPIILSDEQINDLLGKCNIESLTTEGKYIQNIKDSLDILSVLIHQEYPPYNLAKDSFEKY